MDAIAVDALGGDHAPRSEVAGALAAVRESEAHVILCGDRERLRAELARQGGAEGARLELRHASQVVSMDDHPGKAFRQKPDSSLRVAMDLVKQGAARALVSAGNSGAALSHALFVLGRLPEVERPGIVTVFPTPPPSETERTTGTLVLCDMGANVEVKPTMLAQFGVLGAHYDRIVHGRGRPRVGLLSNGTEESKGTELTRAAHALLRRAADHPRAGFEFVGYVEGTDLFAGRIDVVATDGFTGNIVLKTAEGVSQAVLRMVKDRLASSWRGRLGGALVRGPMRRFVRDISASETGGALLVGVDGVVIIAHGKSDGTAIKNAILAGLRFARAELPRHLGEAIHANAGLWQPAAAETA